MVREQSGSAWAADTAQGRMPALFIGHGSPMNAIEDNEFSRAWAQLGQSLPPPKAVLCISAHWERDGTYVTAAERPKTIHDFYGFPKVLNEVRYPAPGAPDLARRIGRIFGGRELRKVARIAVAALVAGGAGQLARGWLEGVLPGGGLGARALLVAGTLVVAGVPYLLTAGRPPRGTPDDG